MPDENTIVLFVSGFFTGWALLAAIRANRLYRELNERLKAVEGKVSDRQAGGN